MPTLLKYGTVSTFSDMVEFMPHLSENLLDLVSLNYVFCTQHFRCSVELSKAEQTVKNTLISSPAANSLFQYLSVQTVPLSAVLLVLVIMEKLLKLIHTQCSRASTIVARFSEGF